jgi:hypothetical protein
MSPTEGQQPIIETTGVEKPKVPETSEDYQAMVVEPIPGAQNQERWYPTEGEPTLDVPVVRVEDAESRSELGTVTKSESSEQEVPAHPGEFDPSKVESVERNKPKRGMGVKGKLAAVALTLGLTAGAAGGAIAMNSDADKVSTGDKTEQEENTDKYSGISTQGTELGRTDVPAESETKVETQSVEANTETIVSPEDTNKNLNNSPTTTVPQPEQNTPVEDKETDLDATPENLENNADVEKAAQSVVMLADFFIGNEPLTGLSPVIEMGEDNSGTLTYSGEGYSISVTGEMEDGLLKQNPLDSLKGFHGITVTIEGKTVSTMMDTKTGLPALQLIVDGEAFTTNGTIYPNAQLDKALVLGNAQEITENVKEKATKK